VKFYIFSLESVGRLVRWSLLLTFSPEVLGSSHKQARKEEQKIKNLPSDQKSESHFSLKQNQQPKLRAGILRVILSDRNFRFYKKKRNPTEVSVELKPEKFSKFRVKMYYCEVK
jgi:hypothetical protein